jgi:hypothetical protein
MSIRTLVGLSFIWGCGGIASVSLDGGGTEAGPDVEIIDASTVPETSTSDVSVTETSGAFTPASLSNLVLWLDATQLVMTDTSGNVASWGDLSSYKNNATAASYAAPTVLGSGIDGLASIHFGSAQTPPSLQIADATSLQWGTGDFLVAIVARYTNDPANGDTTGAANFFWKSTFQGQSGSGVSFWGNVPLMGGTVVDGLLMLEDQQDYVFTSAAYNDDIARVFVARRSGSTMELRVNGTSTATQTQMTSVDVSAVGIPVVIGAIGYSYYQLLGDVAEVIALSGPTTPANVTLLETYLQTKYAL